MVIVAHILFAAVVTIAAVAIPPTPQPDMRVHESLAGPPAGYIAVMKAEAHTPLTLHLALTPRNEDGLIDKLYRVSDPKSPEYGKYLSNDQVAEYMAPTPEASSAVNDWLSVNGVKSEAATPAGDWLKFTTTVAQANALFDADFTVFAHPGSDARILRTLQYSLPAALQPHIALLFPGISFGGPAQTQPRFIVPSQHPPQGAALPERCTSTSITPDCVQSLYGIPTTPAAQASNSLGVAGFNNEYANRADLKQFLTKYRPQIANSTFVDVLLDEGKNLQDIGLAGLEANLDIQYTVGLATNVPTYFVSVGKDNQDSLAGFLELSMFLLGWSNQPFNRPQVLSVSYTFDERDHSNPLLERLCAAYAVLGTFGTSLLFATGDYGVGGKQNQSCHEFIPTYPSSCPFVTAVGATTGIINESGASFSGGGFSNYFPRPAYQSAAVEAFIAKQDGLNAGRYNVSGRAYPDVAAIGEHIFTVLRGRDQEVLGTSASAPIFASVIALINDRRAARGLPSLGFLNPFLYANPHAFNDITVGINPACESFGWPATLGWDAVTGLGTPNFAALAAAAGV